MSQFTVADNPEQHRYEVTDEDGSVLGFSAYRRDGDVVVFTAHRGRRRPRGTRASARRWSGAPWTTYARPACRVRPLCPFVKAYVDRHPEYADLVRRLSSTDEPMRSRRSRMTPSRSAQGQISSSGRSNRSSTASATSAPATIWCARLGETPGSSPTSSADISSSFGTMSRSTWRVEHPSHQQTLAGRRGAADPGQRPEGLRGRDGVVGCGPEHRPGVARDVGADLLAQLAHGVRGDARGEVVPGQPARPQRQRLGDVGRLVRPDRDLQRPAADVEHGQPARRPAEPPAHGQERQPCLVLAGQHLDRRRPSVSRTCSSTSSELRRVPDRRGGEAGHLLAALVLGDHHRRRDERGQGLHPLVGHRPRARRGARRAAAAPCACTPAWGRAARGVDDEEVPGVGADVENAQPHARNLSSDVGFARA